MKVSKRQIETAGQSLPALPGLWIIATPIGNLAEISARAKEGLQKANAILCEDTRQSRKLLSALGMTALKLERCDEQVLRNRPEKIKNWIQRLKQGEILALISDAGTPAVCDPGAVLVQEVRKAGIRVSPFSGPSSLMTFLSACGVLENSFGFKGFFPRKNSERELELRCASQCEAIRFFIWFESPQRIVGVLTLVARLFPQHEVVVSKELTKIYEKFFSGTATQVLEEVKKEITTSGKRGEWCFAIRFTAKNPTAVDAAVAESSDWIKALENLINSRFSVSRAAKKISQDFGIRREVVYEMALQILGKK